MQLVELDGIELGVGTVHHRHLAGRTRGEDARQRAARRVGEIADFRLGAALVGEDRGRRREHRLADVARVEQKRAFCTSVPTGPAWDCGCSAVGAECGRAVGRRSRCCSRRLSALGGDRLRARGVDGGVWAGARGVTDCRPRARATGPRLGASLGAGRIDFASIDGIGDTSVLRRPRRIASSRGVAAPVLLSSTSRRPRRREAPARRLDSSSSSPIASTSNSMVRSSVRSSVPPRWPTVPDRTRRGGAGSYLLPSLLNDSRKTAPPYFNNVPGP